MRKLSRVATLAVTTLVASILSVPAYACTGVIIGKDLTVDGSTIFGRTEDLEQNHPKRLLVHQAGQYKKGQQIPEKDAPSWAGSKWIQEKDSLKFTSISDVTPDEGLFDEAGFNSAGVAVDATVSAGASDATLKVDPYRDGSSDELTGGWEESALTTVLLANATSAKEGIQLMAQMVDKDGMAEGDILTIADKNELWYMELYSGHQYVAMKYPSDKYSVFPNAYWLNRAKCNDTANFICSKDLEKVAEQAGTLVKNSDGTINPAASYNPEGAQQDDGNASRVWSGLKSLDSGNPATLDQKDDYPLLNTPSKEFKKLSITDAMKMQRERFQGIDDSLAKLSEKVAIDKGFLDANKKKVKGARYPVGNTNVLEAHIFQIPGASVNMPATIPGTLWQTIGTPQGSPYLPYYGNITSTIEPMQSMAHTKRLPKGNNPRLPFMEDNSSYYWVATAVSKYVEENRAKWAGPVMQQLHLIENPLIAARPAQDAKLAKMGDTAEAAKWATDDFTKDSTNAYATLKKIKEYIANHNDPETVNEPETITAVKPLFNNNKGEPQSATATGVAGTLPLAPELVVVDSKDQKMGDYDLKAAWDIELLTKITDPATAVQPLKPLTLTIPVKLTEEELKGLKLLHNHDGKISVLDYTYKNGAITFTTSSLSNFGLGVKGVNPSPTPVTPAPVKPAPKAVNETVSHDKLANTGTDAGLLAGVALAAVVLGGVTVAVRRRFR